MHLLMIILLTLAGASHVHCFYSKCCKEGEYLDETASKCIENKLRRLYVVTNYTDFINDNVDGECLETSTDFFKFKVAAGKIIGKSSVKVTAFPKCCPLGYSYNTIVHGCEKSEANFTGNFIVEKYDFTENYVKIGLPSCKIIVDYELAEIDPLKYKSLPDDSYCFDRNEKGSFTYRECKENFDICENMRCIKKCCPDGQSFINRSSCFDTYKHGINLTTFSSVDEPEAPFAVISNRICRKIYMMKGQYNFHLDSRGKFELWHNKTKSFIPYDVSDMKSYCVEHTKTPSIDDYLFFMCFPDTVVVKKFQYTLVPKIISCIALVLTVLVYVILNETRNVFGKLLINYCVALFVETAVLTYASISLHPTSTDCIIRAFGILFFASASFSWSNVICYDIYRTFGSMKNTTGPLTNGMKKLGLYFLYGWGVPIVMSLLILFFYKVRILPSEIQPYLADNKCFFDRKEGNYSQVLFFNLPHLIIQLVNVYFFIKTTIHCIKVKNEINKIKDTVSDERNKKFQKDKEKLFLILKLSVIMGLSFTFEVVSSFTNMAKMGPVFMYIEIIWDAVNCLQGVFIFIIFICKRKIYNDLLKKFNIAVPRSMSFSSLSTQTTLSSNRTSKRVSNSEITNFNLNA